MAKVKAPLFSLDARGKIADTLVYAVWKGLNYCRKYVIPFKVLGGQIFELDI